GLIGVVESGGVYVPVDPTYPAERMALVLADSEPAVILTLSSRLQELPPSSVHTVCLDSDWTTVKEQGLDDPYWLPSPDNAVYVIYTSGSTGIPRGVVVTHRSLANSTSARFDYYEAVDRFVLLSSFAFDSSVAGIFWTICTGGVLLLP